LFFNRSILTGTAGIIGMGCDDFYGRFCRLFLDDDNLLFFLLVLPGRFSRFGLAVLDECSLWFLFILFFRHKFLLLR